MPPTSAVAGTPPPAPDTFDPDQIAAVRCNAWVATQSEKCGGVLGLLGGLVSIALAVYFKLGFALVCSGAVLWVRGPLSVAARGGFLLLQRSPQ